MKKMSTIKIIIGLGLASPLPTMALELNGTQTYNEEINIPSTDYPENRYAGIWLNSNSNTTFNESVTINLSNVEGVNGISDNNIGSSNVIFNKDLTIHIKSDNTTSSSSAINLSWGSDSNITVNGFATLSNECITTCNEDLATDTIGLSNGKVILNGGSDITGEVNVQGEGEVIINGKSIINGYLNAYDGGKVSLDLANGSNFTGYSDNHLQDLDDEDDDGTPGYISINMQSGSVWNIKDYSSVNSLSGQGTLNFNNTNSAHTILYIENLSGSSLFNMRSDVVQQQSDKIVIGNNAVGNHTLHLTNNGNASTTGQETLTLVEGGSNNTATFRLANAVELGGYQYTLNQNGNNVELTSNDGSSKPQKTSTAKAGTSFLNTNYLMSYIETQTLLQRLGDMRNSGQYGDVWLRGFAGKMDSFSGRLSKFDMNYHGFQFGADKQLSETSPLVVGAFVGQTYGDPDYRSGDGSWKSFNTGIYAAYLDNDGFYIDGVAKYVRQKNHFKVRDTVNETIQGTGHANGLGLSVELGKKYKINDFYIEPQSQLSYTHQNATSINATNGLKIKLGNYTSLIGRASALFGYEITNNDNSVNIYLKTGIIREFDGDTHYKLNNNKESYSFKGNWWNNGLGINTQLHKNHSFYIELDSNIGNNFDQLQANGGYRYSF